MLHISRDALKNEVEQELLKMWLTPGAAADLADAAVDAYLDDDWPGTHHHLVSRVARKHLTLTSAATPTRYDSVGLPVID